MSLKSNIWKYNIFSFLERCIFYVPFIVFYFQSLGLNLTQIMFMNGTFAITLFILEIPTGYIADKIGRKNSLIIGILFQIVSMIVLYSFQSYSLFILSHVLLGVAVSFISGADSALLYDTLLSLKKEKEYTRYDGRAKFYSEIAIIISTATASLIVFMGITNLILYTVAAYIILLALTFSFKEPPVHKLLKVKTSFKEIFSFVGTALKNKKLIRFFIYAFFIFGFSNTIFIFYQPYFSAVNIPLYWFGWIFAFFSIFTALASYKAHSIEKFLGVKKTLILIPVFLLLSFLFSSVFFLWFGIIFFIFREFVRGLINPVLSAYTNKLVSSDRRATVLSVQSMFSRMGYFIISIFAGFISDVSSIRVSSFVLAGILLVVMIIVFSGKKFLRIASEA